MPEEINLEHRPGHLRAAVGGVFSLDRAREGYDRVLEECVHSGESRVLIDVRDMKGDIPIIDRYAFGQHMAQVRRSGLRVAFLGTQEQVLADKFLETVANNLGIPTFVTTRPEEAEAWLQKA